jgi:hypothetical protein
MSPADRQLLSDQLVRVYRAIESDRIIEDARQATAPRATDALIVSRPTPHRTTDPR